MRDGAEDMERQSFYQRGRINPFLQTDQIDVTGFAVLDCFEEFPALMVGFSVF